MPNEQKKTITARRKFNPFYIVVVAVVFAAAFSGLKVYPTLQENKKLSDQIFDAETKIKKQEEKLREAKEEAANLTPTDEEILRQNQIPEEEDIASLLRYLEEITPYNTTEYNKIDLKSVSLSKISVGIKEARRKKAEELKISLSIVSSPSAFRNLLKELERSDKRVFSISDISVTEVATGPISKRGKYNLSMIAYNQK